MSRGAIKWVLAAAILGGGFVTTEDRAFAQPAAPAAAAPAPAPAPRRVVAVSIVGGATDEARLLEETIRELLSRLSLMMVGKGALAPSVSASSLLASVDVDLGNASNGAARVIVKSVSGATVIDRTVARDSTAAIQREQIAHAVRGAAEAEVLADEDRVAGRAPAVVVVPPPPPTTDTTPPPPTTPTTEKPPEPKTTPDVVPTTPAAPPTPTTPSAFAFEVSTFAGAGLFADDVGPVARVGGAAGVAYRRGIRPSIALALFYAFPFESGSAALTSRAQIISLRLIPAIEVLHKSRFGVDVGAGGGIDVLSVDPSTNIYDDKELMEPAARVDPMLGAVVTGRVAVASDVVITLSGLADVDLMTRRYVFNNRGQQSDVLVPWTFRPMLVAGLSFTAVGEGRGER